MHKLQKLVERDQWAELLSSSKELHKQSIHSNIEILSFSEKEALKKASEIFNVPEKFLTTKEIRKGSSSFFGLIKVPSSFIFSVKEDYTGVTPDNYADYDTYNDLAKNKNGSFTLVMKQKGLFLQVFPPKGVGNVVKQEEIEEALKQKGYEDVNTQLLRKAINSFEAVMIAPYVYREGEDSEYYVTVAKDYMNATFTMTKPLGQGRIPELTEIVGALKKEGVNAGIKEEFIQEALDNELFNIPVVAAEGLYPKNGANAYVEYNFSTGEGDEFKYAIRPDGSIDFKELNIIQNVREGDVLAVIHPSSQGEDGYNVLGEKLDAQDGQTAECNIGSNVALSADKSKVVATSAGQVFIKNKQICVDPALEISSDVDLTTGNITFLGNIIIKGSVTDGFSVTSGGNIEVHGHIGRCTLTAEGNIIAHQGIQGKDEAHIECKGNLFARFIERSMLYIGGNLVVTRSILHSKAVVEKGIYVLDEKKSIIAGGDIKAQNEIVVSQLGAESYIETHVEVGYSKNILKKNITLQKNIEKYSEQITEYKNEVMMHSPVSIDFKRLQKMIASATIQKNKSEAFFEQNKKILNKLIKSASISVSKSIMPGVRVKIGQDMLDITMQQGSGTIKNTKNAIALESYAPSSLLSGFKSEAEQYDSRPRKRR